MANYRSMYTRLFNTITDVIDLLKTAQKDTEELFIRQEGPTIYDLDNPDSNE